MALGMLSDLISAVPMSAVMYVMSPLPKLGTTLLEGVVAITTSPPGNIASGAYWGNGPWFRRLLTGGPDPKSYPPQLCAGTNGFPSLVPIPTTAAANPPDLKKVRRSIRHAPFVDLCVPIPPRVTIHTFLRNS